MDDSQGNTNAEEIQQSAIPTDDKPTEADEPKLPDGAAERTKAEFEKLKAHNAQLKEELDVYKTKTSVLDDLKPSQNVQVETPSLNDTQVSEIKSQFVDENGYVDVVRLESALREADTRARQAEARVQKVEARVQGYEETVQVKAAHSQYQQLDPKSDKFDPTFYKLVKNELIGQMMNGEQDLLKAAHEVSKIYTPKVDVSQAKEEAVKEYKTKATKREQAGVSAGERGLTQPDEREELRQKTLKGDDKALYKRLQASGN